MEDRLDSERRKESDIKKKCDPVSRRDHTPSLLIT